MKSLLPLVFVATALDGCAAYSVSPRLTSETPLTTTTSPSAPLATTADSSTTRRQALTQFLGFAAGVALAPQVTHADIDVSTIEMKEFVDPYGLFAINVPNGFYTLRRKAKGDLPDEKTGKGRRGSSIFTAGNMAKAEIIAVER